MAAEALVVAEILSKRQSGMTLTAIADELNQLGITGKKGGKWFASSVSYTINRQAA